MSGIREAGRLDEMSHGEQSLHVQIQNNSDITVYIAHDGVAIEDKERHVAKVTFCCTASGGGRSRRVRRALGELFSAMVADGREMPDGIPPYPTYLKGQMLGEPR